MYNIKCISYCESWSSNFKSLAQTFVPESMVDAPTASAGCKFVRDAEFQVPPQMHWTRICVLEQNPQSMSVSTEVWEAPSWQKAFLSLQEGNSQSLHFIESWEWGQRPLQSLTRDLVFRLFSLPAL